MVSFFSVPNAVGHSSMVRLPKTERNAAQFQRSANVNNSSAIERSRSAYRVVGEVGIGQVRVKRIHHVP